MMKINLNNQNYNNYNKRYFTKKYQTYSNAEHLTNISKSYPNNQPSFKANIKKIVSQKPDIFDDFKFSDKDLIKSMFLPFLLPFKIILAPILVKTRNDSKPNKEISQEDKIKKWQKNIWKNLTKQQRIIAKERCLLEYNPKRSWAEQFQLNDIQVLTGLSDKHFKNLRKRGLFYVQGRENLEHHSSKKQFDGEDLEELAKLSNGEFQKAKQLLAVEGRKQFLGFQIAFLSKLSDSEFKRVNELLVVKGRSQFEWKELKQLACLPKEEYKKAKKILVVSGRDELSAYQISRFAYCENFERGRELLSTKGLERFSCSDILDLSKLNDEEFEKAKKIFIVDGRRQFGVFEIKKLAELSDEEFARAQKLMYIPERGEDAQFFGMDIYRLAKMSPEKLEIAKQYFNIPFPQKLSGLYIINIAEMKTTDFYRLNFQDQLKWFSNIDLMMADIKDPDIIKYIDFKTKKEELENILNASFKNIKVESKAKSEFFKKFIVINETDTKNILTNLSPVIDKYGASGLPLKYPRSVFVQNLNKILATLPKAEQYKILNKLNIELTPDKNGYNGLLDFYNLNPENKTERAVLNETRKFLLNNEIVTGDKKTDDILNSLIKGIPEFINVIGKKQHATHKYTVDCHTLKVLETALKDENFDKLTPQNKLILQLSIIFHDIGKNERVIDSTHEIKSAAITKNVLNRFSLPVNVKKRIVEFIKNHDWFAQLQKGVSKEQIALKFRYPQEMRMAEIFAKADLSGVSEEFYQRIMSHNNMEIDQLLSIQSKIFKSGNMLFTTKILNPSKIPTVLHNGYGYKVIDFSKISDNDDLFKYGLGVRKKSDFRALFHHGHYERLNFLVNNTNNDSCICASLLSLQKKATYACEQEGLMLESENLDIVNSSVQNQSSGCAKNFKFFMDEIFRFDYRHRNFSKEIFQDKIREKLKYKLTDAEYGKIYKSIQSKKYFSQITDEKIGDKLIPKQVIVEAVRAIEDTLLQRTYKDHNEVNLYNPQIKGIILVSKPLKKASESILKFARENNLPIFILN